MNFVSSNNPRIGAAEGMSFLLTKVTAELRTATVKYIIINIEGRPIEK